MSRLYDRVMAHGCEPLNAQHVIEAVSDDEERRRATASLIEEELGRVPSPAEVSEHLARARSVTQRHVSSASYEAADFDGAVVVSAEEVADLWATFPEGTRILDILDRLAPPFGRMFVEFQNRSNTLGLRSWGLLLGGSRLPEGHPPQEGFDDQGWELTCVLIGSGRKRSRLARFSAG